MSTVAAEGLFVVALVSGLAVPFVIWALTEAETDDTDVMDRRTAEESARADSRGDAERRARRDTDDGSDRGF